MQAVTHSFLNHARFNMLQKQLREQFMLSETILDAYSKMPRHLFVPKHYEEFAYSELHIPLNHHECMLRPNEEARILAALNILPTDKILEIGTGSGFFTALLATLGHFVVSLDIHHDFITAAQNKLETLNLHNINLVTQNGVSGYEKEAPYDVICFTGGLHYLDKKILSQLHPQGRVFVFLGECPSMKALILKKNNENFWDENLLFETEINYLHDIPEPPKFQF